MQPDTLCALVRLRKQALDNASRHLSGCIQAETAATQAVRSQAADIDHQRRMAEAAGSADSDVEAFGRWFGNARVRLGVLSADYDRAAVETARARAELMVARTALEVLETLLRDGQLAAAAEETREEQKQSDDLSMRTSATTNVR